MKKLEAVDVKLDLAMKTEAIILTHIVSEERIFPLDRNFYLWAFSKAVQE